jgi:hypothetical protein
VLLLVTASFVVSLKLKISPERSKFVSRVLAARAKGESLTEDEERELKKVEKECF